MELELLTGSHTKCKAKSTLNKSAEFACKNMFDGTLDTCWNSDQGSPQHLIIAFERPVSVGQLAIVFQGGFCGQDGIVELGNSLDSLASIGNLDVIEDSNDLQRFEISQPETSGVYLKITFLRSTDFYGRITIYNLMVYGRVLV